MASGELSGVSDLKKHKNSRTSPPVNDGQKSSQLRALVRGEGGSARIVAVNISAWQVGIRVGRTLAEARAKAPSLAIAILDNTRIYVVEDIIQRALVSVSPRLGHAMAAPHSHGEFSNWYGEFLVEVDSKETLNRLIEVVTDVDLGVVSIGVADGAFASQCAARVTRPRERPIPKRTPRGEDAAFLSPLPSAWLPATSLTLDALHSLGLDTLGLVAALPLEGVQTRLGEEGRVLVRLARGEALPSLATTIPSEHPSTEVSLGDGVTEGTASLDALVFALRSGCLRLLPPIASQGFGITELEIWLDRPIRAERVQVDGKPHRPRGPLRILVRPSRAEVDTQTLFELARATLEGALRERAHVSNVGDVVDEHEVIYRVRLVALAVAKVESVGEKLGFAQRDATLLPLDVTLARLSGRFGAARVMTPIRREDPRPDERGRFVPAQPQSRRPLTSKAIGRDSPPHSLASKPRMLGVVHAGRLHITDQSTRNPIPIRESVFYESVFRERLRTPPAVIGNLVLSRLPEVGEAWPLRGTSDPRAPKRVVARLTPAEHVASGWWDEPFALVYRWVESHDGRRLLFARGAAGGGYRLVGIAD